MSNRSYRDQDSGSKAPASSRIIDNSDASIHLETATSHVGPAATSENEQMQQKQSKRPKESREEASPFTKFRLLMWKNFLQQWRHPVQTAIELVLPVLTMSAILILRWKSEPYSLDTTIYQPFAAHTLNFSHEVLGGMNSTSFSIAFSPRSSVLEDVIRTAVAKMILHNIVDHTELLSKITGMPLPANANAQSADLVNIIKSQVSVKAYNNSAELRGIYIQEIATKQVLAAVQFDNSLLDAEVLPNDVSYSLRFPEKPRLYSFYALGGRTWRTELVFPAFEMAGGRYAFSLTGGNDPGYVNEVFTALQDVISMELISRKTGKDMTDFRVNIQRYPHPPGVVDYATYALKMLLPLFMMLSFSYSVVNIVRCITTEKELQLKETMKIMGLPSWYHWTAWFCKQFIYLSIAAVLLVILLKGHWFTNSEGFSEYSVFTHTPWTVLFFFILLYLTCAIFFCFMLSGIFAKGSTAALFTGVVWFIAHTPATLLTMDEEVSVFVQAITSLSINSAMTVGFHQLLARESFGGMQWGEFFDTPSPESDRFTFGHVLIMFVLDSILYMLLALYFEQIVPGPYGAPQKWNFIFKRKFCCPHQKSPRAVLLPSANKANVVQEKDPIGHAIGVQMIDLTKVYKSNVVVNQLSLNIFDDQITVLLGHNGAGKSTTISMLTGNVVMTSGSVSVAGYDMATQVREARSHLGLCPQHNVLFNELTVREHLKFFARLKGFKGQQLERDIDSLIEKLELQEKRNYQAHGLSGGQKRRLCVGIALSGAPRVVLLDEPTSGMDPASRRGLWDLLQKEKKDRSMILTTHFMDEADYLGDRVAIMAQGQLKCVGTPQFLKNHYGMGYTLVVVKKENFDLNACTELLGKHIPGIVFKEDRVSEVSYSLQNDQSHLFEDMLVDLEANVDKIQYDNYGLVATTIEDVFMSLGADLPLKQDSDDTSDQSIESESLEQLNSLNDQNEVKGYPLLRQHVKAVWMKLWLVWLRSWELLILQLVVPLLLVNMFLAITQYVMSLEDEVTSRHLTLAKGFAKTETLLNYNGSSDTAHGALAKAAYEDIITKSGVDSMELIMVNDTIEKYYLDRGADLIEMGIMRHSVVIGATFDENSATAHFSNFGYHDVAISLATVHSALLKVGAPEAIMNVYNWPLEATYSDQNSMNSMVALLSMQLANAMGSSVGIVSAVFIMFYIRERACGAKLLQNAAGLQPAVLWMSTFVFDWLWFCIICIVIISSCWLYDIAGLSTLTEIVRLYMVLLLYGTAMLPMNYLLSNFFNGAANGFVVVFFLNIIIGMMGPQLVDALRDPEVYAEKTAEAIDCTLQILPMYSLISCISWLNKHEIVIQSCLASCDFLSSQMPSNETCNLHTMCKYFSTTCCIGKDDHWKWEEPGIMRYITCMIFSGIVFWTIHMVIEYRLLKMFFTTKRTPPPIVLGNLDSDVADEIERVDNIAKADRKQYGLVSKRLSKYYGKHLAVNQNSFTVSDRECFGLLGVNGAGKTTTFKMLMGDEAISSGRAYVGGYSVESQLTRVHENIGYCPQFDALFDEMTGRETLRLFCLLRGIPPAVIPRQTAILASSLGFVKHLDKRVHKYSGGNKRKVSTAVAFLGRTRLVFVDEPTTGVDPAAKRHVWRAVRSVQRAGRGVVLTSHSMEECEALCSRLTIMVNGRFQCLGTPQHLKNKFSEGYTLTIKLKCDDNATKSANDSDIQAVKHFVNTNFTKSKLMEEYQSVVTYYLADKTLPWSMMFGIMERARRNLAVEYYSISQTTLEQIFLQFTKYQEEQTLNLL